MRKLDNQPWYADIEAYIDERDRLDRLRRGFSGLTSTQRRRLVKRHLGGMTYGDIGRSEGVSTPIARRSCLRGEHILGGAFRIWSKKG